MNAVAEAKPLRTPHSALRTPEISLVVTAHEPYLRFLPDLLALWDAHEPQPVAKFLVLDHCDYQAPEGWTVIRGSYGHPALARNAALDQVATPWVYFWDADNTPPRGLLSWARRAAEEASPTTGLIYSGPDRANLDPREAFWIDTNSLWRTAAVRHVGGWPHTWLEDWHLGNKLRAAGWEIAPLGLAVERHMHPEQRSKTERLPAKIWTARPIGIVTLFRGDTDLLRRWECTLAVLDLPPQCGLTVVDDGGTAAFSRKLKAALRRVEHRFQRLTILSGDPAPKTREFHPLHARVGRMYSRAVSCSPEPAILFWEDDTFPETGSALRDLAAFLGPAYPPRRIAAIGAAYRSRHHPRSWTASYKADRWSGIPTKALPPMPVRVGALGGGFTLFSRAALEQCPVLGPSIDAAGKNLGWDGWLCARFALAKWKVMLHAGVRCEHLV